MLYSDSVNKFLVDGIDASLRDVGPDAQDVRKICDLDQAHSKLPERLQQKGSISFACSHIHLQRRDERFLRNVDLAELPHAFFALLLLIEQFAQLTRRQGLEACLGDDRRRLLR